MWNDLQCNRRCEKYFLVDEVRIEQSHKRCEEAGLPRDLQKPILNRNLSVSRTTLIPLIKYVDLLFLDTQRHISDTSYVFIFTDADGYILTILTDPDVFIHILNPCGLSVGTNLREESSGTSAISLAVYHQESAVVTGQQHYCNIFQDWTCVVTPAFTASNELIGFVGISCSEYSDVGDKLALTNFLAAQLTSFCSNWTVSISDALFVGSETSQILRPACTDISLSTRQKEVLKFYAEGLSYKQIASGLNLNSHKTIEAHLDAIREKLSASSRRECIKKAIDLGLLDM